MTAEQANARIAEIGGLAIFAYHHDEAERVTATIQEVVQRRDACQDGVIRLMRDAKVEYVSMYDRHGEKQVYRLTCVMGAPTLKLVKIPSIHSLIDQAVDTLRAEAASNAADEADTVAAQASHAEQLKLYSRQPEPAPDVVALDFELPDAVLVETLAAVDRDRAAESVGLGSLRPIQVAR